MAVLRSRVTAQGQVSVPAGIRRKLGVGPGSFLEWEESGPQVVVRRGGRFSSEDIHRKLFGQVRPKPKSLEQLNKGIGKYVRKRYALD